MKILMLITALTGAAALYAYGHPAGNPQSPAAEPRARLGAEGAAALAAAPAAPAEAVAQLSRAEIEAKISAIDSEIERRHLVEKSNRGELEAGELRDLRRLLDRRNQYFLRKIDVDLGNGGTEAL